MFNFGFLYILLGVVIGHLSNDPKIAQEEKKRKTIIAVAVYFVLSLNNMIHFGIIVGISTWVWAMVGHALGYFYQRKRTIE